MSLHRILSALMLFGVLSAVAPQGASAVERVDFVLSNTEDLLDVCSVAENDPFRTEAVHYCVAYLEGAVDYHDAITDHENLKRLICYPQDATREQGVRAFIEWGQAHRNEEELMSAPTVIGVVRALAAKWPCS